MDTQVTRREKRRSFLGAIAVASVIMLIGAPVVQAAVQTVKVRGAVKVKGTNNVPIESEAIPGLGLFDAEGSTGALAVRNFAGGGGLLGTGDCTAASQANPDPANPADVRSNTYTVPASADTIITGIIITGPDANVSVSAPDLLNVIGPGAVNTFSTNRDNSTIFVGLGNGLTVTPSKLVFSCTGDGGGDGSGNFTILGQ